jgi:hypothetical protein
MKRLILTLFASLAIMQAEALLPPLYQSTAEIKAILADDQLGKKLQSGEIIKKIKKNAQGYEIITNHHRLQVTVENEPSQGPGPAHFKLIFDNPTPY